MSKKIDDLNTAYNEGETSDKQVFAEMRSNVLMHSGDHYKKTSDRLYQRIKDSKTSESLKLKLVKNHIQVITKTYISNIVSQAPGVRIVPYNEIELRDQKDAELCQAVWQSAEETQNIDEKIDRWAGDFVVIGEVAAKIFWNPNKGKLKGYKQATTDQGQPLYTGLDGKPTTDTHTFAPGMIAPQAHKPMQGEEPVFEGELEIEPIFPFNLIRPKNCEDLKDADWLAVRKVLSIEDAKALVSNIPDKEEREEKESYIQQSSNSTFKVFDGTSGEYTDTKDQVLIREFYYKPCMQYPEGYYYITTEYGILFEGSTPFGLYPLVTAGFDKIPTSARSRSIIKALRGPQANINMLASKKYEHVVTMGDDKIITQAGSKLSKGAQWAGVREFNVTGPAPTVLPGRAGEQFESSLLSEIAEIYRLANLEYEKAESGQQDAYAKLFMSLSQRKKYGMYVRTFERFLCGVANLYLKLARHYLPDDYIIKAVGKREAINIAEFKATTDDGFRIKLKPMSNDIESMMGKQLNIMHILQYVGKNMPPNVIGKALKAMPFVNEDQIFNDLTLDDENIESDILALDRGEQRPAEPSDKHDLYLARLGNRMKQSDFRMLPPQVQQNYQQKVQQHQEAMAQQVRELKEAEAGFIPSGGGLTKVDIYGPDNKRIVIPQEALQWLIQMLEKQGSGQQQLQQMDQAQQIEVLKKAMSNQQGMPQQQAGMPSQPQ